MRVVDNVGFDVKKQDIPGGGSGNGQPLATPDWNQNDETAADYIKNRPFYTSDSVETELVNGTFAFTSPREGLYVNTDITIELTEGETYKVTIDGVEYETVCQNYNGALYIGSIKILTGGTPEYPFVYTPADGSFATNIEGVSHEIVIKSIKSQIVQIPDKYLPLGDYVSKNGDTINGDLVMETAVGQNTSYAGLEKVNIMGMDLACQTVGIKAVSGGDGKFAIAVMDAPMLCTLQNGEFTSALMWNADANRCMLSLVHAKNGDLPFSMKIKTPATNEDEYAANKKYVDDTVAAHVTDKELILASSTSGSTKQFKITVDDTGALTATEVTG